jgi:hypothetical protein
MHRLAFLVLPLLAALSFATAAPALELLLFRRAGCPWCAAWDREVGPIYPKTELGRRVPIRFVDLDRGGDAKVALASPVRYSPTFVLVEAGREIGRIEGYPGEDFFWGRLEALVPPPPPGGRTSALAPTGVHR